MCCQGLRVPTDSSAISSSSDLSAVVGTLRPWLYPNVYVPKGAEVTAGDRARAAWLWCGRRGIVAGQSAAAVHGAKWVEARTPAELLWPNRRPPRGVHAWSDGLADDEVELFDGIRVTTPARTALDLACRYPLRKAVAAIDALAERAAQTA